MRGVLLHLLLAAVCWGGATAFASREPPRRAEQEELLYYPSGRFLREAVLGYDQAAASIAWLRTVQYYGRHARSDRQFDMMYHLCDIVTELDPKFEEPYIFGSFVILTEGGKTEEGVALLQKGLVNHPGSWRIQFEAGFVNYLVLGEYAKAVRYFTAASELPGAPAYTRRFAAFVAERAGQIEAAIVMWSEFAAQTDNPELRAKAEKEVEKLRQRLEERDGVPGGGR